MPRVAVVARALGLSFAPAVVGFGRGGGGRPAPTLDGVVVAAASEALLTEAYSAWAQEEVARAAEKRHLRAARRWAALAAKALTRQRVRDDYGAF